MPLSACKDSKEFLSPGLREGNFELLTIMLSWGKKNNISKNILFKEDNLIFAIGMIMEDFLNEIYK